MFFGNQVKRRIHFRGHIPDVNATSADGANLRAATQSASTVSASRTHNLFLGNLDSGI
jgi:hypothetical protein